MTRSNYSTLSVLPAVGRTGSKVDPELLRIAQSIVIIIVVYCVNRPMVTGCLRRPLNREIEICRWRNGSFQSFGHSLQSQGRSSLPILGSFLGRKTTTVVCSNRCISTAYTGYNRATAAKQVLYWEVQKDPHNA